MQPASRIDRLLNYIHVIVTHIPWIALLLILFLKGRHAAIQTMVNVIAPIFHLIYEITVITGKRVTFYVTVGPFVTQEGRRAGLPAAENFRGERIISKELLMATNISRHMFC